MTLPRIGFTLNPGLLGWLLRKAGWPLEPSQHAQSTAHSVFRTTCPVCGNEEAHLLGPRQGDELLTGVLVCPKCEDQLGLEKDAYWIQFSPKIQEEVLDLVAHWLGYPDSEVALSVAYNAVNATLPPLVDLRSSEKEAVMAAVDALEHAGEPQELTAHDVEMALTTCCRWTDRKGHKIAVPWPWVVAKVQRELQLRRAHKLAVAAIELTCLRTGRSDVQVDHLLEHAADECRKMVDVLEWEVTGPVDRRVVGSVLRTLPSHPVAGTSIVATGKTKGSWRWKTSH